MDRDTACTGTCVQEHATDGTHNRTTSEHCCKLMMDDTQSKHAEIKLCNPAGSRQGEMQHNLPETFQQGLHILSCPGYLIMTAT